MHVDVMDGHFVPNITIGLPVVRSLKKISPLPLDVHLMISHPLKYAAEFAKAGSDYITFHIDREDVTADKLAAIRAGGAKAGLTLRPGTPVERLLPYLPEVDMVLIMTVEPGFGGQSFMADMLPKIEVVRRWKDEHKPHMLIEVDGGINKDTAPLAIAAGADVLVAGSAVFGRSDYAAAIAQCGPKSHIQRRNPFAQTHFAPRHSA